MTDLSTFLIIVIVAMVAIPITVYSTVKLARLGWLRAKELHDSDNTTPSSGEK